MKYSIKGHSISSELAAKPVAQGAKFVVDLIGNLEYVNHIVDYGCGKLRYAIHLEKQCDSLTIVDSRIQLNKKQKVHDEQTSVKNYALKHFKNCNVLDIRAFQKSPAVDADILFCANVFSAIPSKSEQTKALKSIKSAIGKKGKFILINQHTNSYYSDVSRREDSIQHLDGYIVKSNRGTTYFGQLNMNKTSELLNSAGFNIVDHYIEGQSNIAIAIV
jgi:hypothetical protein